MGRLMRLNPACSISTWDANVPEGSVAAASSAFRSAAARFRVFMASRLKPMALPLAESMSASISPFLPLP